MSGSIRSESTNGALLRAAAGMSSEFQFDVCAQEIAALPAFSPDLDGMGATPPPAVAALRARIGRADGVIVSCPEYAHGVPGAFKNALDWIVSSGEFTDKPTLVWMASPSGAQQARLALLPTLKIIGARIVHDRSIQLARPNFNENGELLSETIADAIAQDLKLLQQFLREGQSAVAAAN